MSTIRLVTTGNELQGTHIVASTAMAFAASMRDRIEYESARFIIEHRKRLIDLKLRGSFAVMSRRQMLLALFEDLVKTYYGLIAKFLRLCGRIEYLRRSHDALIRRGEGRKCRLGLNIQINNFAAELEFREGEEQDILDEIYGVELEIFLLGSEST